VRVDDIIIIIIININNNHNNHNFIYIVYEVLYKESRQNKWNRTILL